MQGALVTALAALLAATLSGCTGTSKEGKPPADMDGTWFGSWEGQDQFGIPIISGFYFVLVHDQDTDLISGSVFSSVAGLGTVTGQTNGSRFTLDVGYPSGDSEEYSGREEFGTISGGDYAGSILGTPLEGDFDMFPAELARSGVDQNAGLVSGHVTTGGGATAVVGATVSIGAGDDRQETVTNGAGDYSFPSVPGGPRVVVISAAAGETAYFPIVVNGTVAVPDINLVPASVPTGNPQIALTQQIDGVTVSNSVVFAQGTLTAIDAQSLVASINGGEFLVPLEAGAVQYPLILSRGVNTITLQSINQNGVTERTLLANANVPPQKVRVTMVWDEGAFDRGGTVNDQDMHIWFFPSGGGGAGQHAYYLEPSAVSNGVIDLDNTFGFGPENFTLPAASAGNYYVAVNFFTGTAPARDIVRISLNEKTPDERVYVFGPQQLTASNGNSGYPVTVNTASWWRVADIVVDATGLASLAAAPNPNTAFALPD